MVLPVLNTVSREPGIYAGPGHDYVQPAATFTAYPFHTNVGPNLASAFRGLNVKPMEQLGHVIFISPYIGIPA